MNETQRKAIGYLIRREFNEETITFIMCLCERHGCGGQKCWECLLEMLESGHVLRGQQE